MAHLGVGATAGATAYVAGKTFFDYNRENYFQDEGLRFQRFTASRSFANTQVTQYREDLRGMTEMVASKLELMHAVATLLMATAAAMSCAGRIGMHGPAPPTWLCGLYTGHIFTSVMLFAVSFWLGMHASLRAQCASVTLLTRKVRLPIPSMAQLDAARAIGSQFEKQGVRDVVRVPYTAQAQSLPAAEEGSSGDSDDEFKRKDREKAKLLQGVIPEKAKALVLGKPQNPRTEFASTVRNTVPTWIRDEGVIDKGDGLPGSKVAGAAFPKHEVPDHFKLYAAAQQDWWPYEINARIALLFGVIQILGAVCYYIIGTCLAELRGMWIAWSSPAIFVTAQACLLRLDIVPNKGQQVLPYLEYAGFAAPFFAVAAGSVEYRYYYSAAEVPVIWIFAITSLVGHMLMAFRMLDLATPDSVQQPERDEVPGRAWWPSFWKVPYAFMDALWIIAPPKKLEKGQHDLMHEMETLKASGGGITADTCRQRKGKKKGSLKKKNYYKVTNMEYLHSEVRKLDRDLAWWENDSIWPKVTEKGKQRVEELRSHLQEVKRQVPGLQHNGDWITQYEGAAVGAEDPYGPAQASGWSRGGSKKGDYGDPASLEGISVQLADVGDRLFEIEDGLRELHASQGVSKDLDLDDLYGPDDTPFAEQNGATFTKQAPALPGRILSLALLAIAFCWIYMIIGCVVEILIWPETLLKWPGEPPWIRDQAHRNVTSKSFSHTSNSGTVPEDYHLFHGISAETTHHLLITGPAHHDGHDDHPPHTDGDDGGHSDGDHSDGDHSSGDDHSGHRRLSSSFQVAGHRRVDTVHAWEEFMNVLPVLNHLARVTDGTSDIEVVPLATRSTLPADGSSAMPVAGSGFMGQQLVAMDVSWPKLFEPSLLACKPQENGLGATLVAMTPHAYGAIASVPASGTKSSTNATTFAMDGSAVGGPMVGASWTSAGLRLINKVGDVVTCPGNGPAGGAWKCAHEPGLRMPIADSAQILAAAMSDSMVALTLNSSSYTFRGTRVELFHRAANGTHWRPSGEVHLPPHRDGFMRRVAALAFVEDSLMVLADSGEVQIRNLTSGSVKLRREPSSAFTVEWHSICALPAQHLPSSQTGRQQTTDTASSLLRLALRRKRVASGLHWRPEVFIQA